MAPVKRRLKNFDYFSYHVEVAKAFQTDCDKLLLAFQAEENLSFKTFADVWNDKHFSFIFNGQRLVDELEYFPFTCFTFVKKYIVFSNNIYVQTGALYTLYGLYYKQPLSDKVKIRCTAEEWKHLKKLVENLKQRAVNDGPFIFEKMKLDGAFKMVLLHNTYGPEWKFMWRKEPLRENTFQSLKKGDPTLIVEAILRSNNYNGLNYISKVYKCYVKHLKKFGFSKKDCAVSSNFCTEINALLVKLLNMGSDQASALKKKRTSKKLKKGKRTSKQLKNMRKSTSKLLKKRRSSKQLKDDPVAKQLRTLGYIVYMRRAKKKANIKPS